MSLLYPNEFKGSFGFDSLRPNYTHFPLSEYANYYDFILEPGEMLLIPYNFPHQVDNLEDSIAVAGNYVDTSNWDAMEEDLRKTAKAGPRFAKGESERLAWIHKTGFKPPPVDFAQKPRPYAEFKSQYHFVGTQKYQYR